MGLAYTTGKLDGFDPIPGDSNHKNDGHNNQNSLPVIRKGLFYPETEGEIKTKEEAQGQDI